VSFLLNPGSYPCPAGRVRLVQTHSSFVFLGSRFVYKVKKPVNFGFLDFSTLEKRRHFCEREVTLNQRLCPGMYLGVVPISIRRGRFTFGRGNRVVEYAVQMRKLSERFFLDKLVERGLAGQAEFDRVVAVLRRFYEEQHPSAMVEQWGRVDRLKISTDENFRQTEPFVGQTLSRCVLDTLRLFTDGFFSRCAGLFERRVRGGRILDCHGDLRLEHIHLTRRKIQIYDCIEFNDRFRYIDVTNDVGFLAMDLDFAGQWGLARHFVASMAKALRDEEMLLLMDFYKCYRATVRGKVESLHSVAPAAPVVEQAVSAERARRFFQLALHYALTGSEPMVLVVMGRVASGKSTVARRLANELGWRLLSSDRMRKERAGLSLYERTSAAVRGRLYSGRSTELLYEELIGEAESEVMGGRCVMIDATFALRKHRGQLRKLLRSRGVRVMFLELRARDGEVKRRLVAREDAEEEASDARLEDFGMLVGRYEAPAELTGAECFSLSSEGPVERTVVRALRGLVEAQLRRSPIAAVVKAARTRNSRSQKVPKLKVQGRP